MDVQIHMTEAVVVCGKFWEVQFDILSHYHHYHTHTLPLSDPSQSIDGWYVYINISSHHPTTATLVATLRSTRPLNPDDDPDDDTASYAYMRCNAMQQCNSPRHASSHGAAHTCLTHTKFLRNLILRPFHVSPFPCLCLSVFCLSGN